MSMYVLLVCIYVLLYLHVMSVCVLVCLLVSLFVCLCVYLFFTGVNPKIRPSRLEKNVLVLTVCNANHSKHVLQE